MSLKNARMGSRAGSLTSSFVFFVLFVVKNGNLLNHEGREEHEEEK